MSELRGRLLSISEVDEDQADRSRDPDQGIIRDSHFESWHVQAAKRLLEAADQYYEDADPHVNEPGVGHLLSAAQVHATIAVAEMLSRNPDQFDRTGVC